ncbi:hypothetical protein BBD42_21605 [Paenibacillus sp. BIHB 4019]|uniref:HTH cro/C1-type domain-containing protein n=1 Tax=Paenibacillus sp. BIHB 4019 TaxID=1870819 RepID=A0A1B2DM35_9BACL|nr:helix-turn-helix transcriptional regulator [Paenibacillus sp. BIHB 4019]ANY68773.1 hypothetical protein BBD42_21605 [Paenibacillus sp. BIHB 4019]
MEDSLIKIGKRVREIRKAKGYSQTSLGEKCGFAFSYIGGIERAENNISIKSLEKIADALDVELYEFFLDHRDTKKLVNNRENLKDIIELLLTLDDKQLKKSIIILNTIFKP